MKPPVIGAINGWAVGGGFEWAINCDFPIWAESARAFFPELKWGMFVTGGVTSLLPALAGLQNAREMMFLGERYDAKTLLEKGVAWRVVPDADLMTEAQAVAHKLLAQSQRSVRAMKRALNQVALVDLRRAIEIEPSVAVFKERLVPLASRLTLETRPDISTSSEPVSPCTVATVTPRSRAAATSPAR